MGTLNKAILIGYLGADPEIRDTLEGAVVTFNLATSFKPVNGQERTQWHKIVAWDKLGALASDYLRKGSQTCVEGRIVTREWCDKQGNKRRFDGDCCQPDCSAGKTARQHRGYGFSQPG